MLIFNAKRESRKSDSERKSRRKNGVRKFYKKIKHVTENFKFEAF